jgi:protein involved in polysaccharide export with SLBB domain
MKSALASTLLLVSAAARLSAQDVPQSAQSPTLKPGDMVQIEVWEQPELSGEFLVATDSSILHPLYREIKVAGIPLDSAERRVRGFLLRFEQAPKFSIQPLFRVFVGGEVIQPREYALRPGTTVADAIVHAGGPTARANVQRVRLLRGGRDIAVDVTNPMSDLAQTTIRSGDQILVQRNRNFFREYLVPAASFAGGIASILRFFTR